MPLVSEEVLAVFGVVLVYFEGSAYSESQKRESLISQWMIASNSLSRTWLLRLRRRQTGRSLKVPMADAVLPLLTLWS